MTDRLTDRDREALADMLAEHLEHRAAVEAFKNFLSWGAAPAQGPRNVPPAWWAYAFGHTTWCPPVGEL